MEWKGLLKMPFFRIRNMPVSENKEKLCSALFNYDLYCTVNESVTELEDDIIILQFHERNYAQKLYLAIHFSDGLCYLFNIIHKI